MSTALLRLGSRSNKVLGLHISRCCVRNINSSPDTIVESSPYEEIRANFDPNSSKSNPMKVNAYGQERTIACVCDDIHFLTLKKGPPMKCGCGYWFQLVDANKFWDQEPA